MSESDVGSPAPGPREVSPAGAEAPAAGPGISTILGLAADLVRPHLGTVGRMSATAATLAARSIRAAEQTALGLLQSRLDGVAPTVGDMPRARRLDKGPHEDPHEDPRRLMGDLLTRGLQQNTATGQRDHHRAVLRQLVPDEARIIATLADGAAVPLVHVHARGSRQPVLANASLVGRLAALTLPSRTPTYVGHLLDLGLVETGPEDRDNEQGYELLLADREVREALKRGELGKLPARVQRLTLRLSRHGRDLWEHTCPSGGAQ